MPPHAGFDRKQAAAFLDRELGRREGLTSFYWENEETEEVLDVVVDAVARLIEANNRKLLDDLSHELGRIPLARY